MMLAGRLMMEVVRWGSWLLGMLNVSVKIPPSDEDDVVKMSPCALVSRGSVVLMMVLRVLVVMLLGRLGRDTVLLSQIWFMSPEVRFGNDVRGSGLMFWNVSDEV